MGASREKYYRGLFVVAAIYDVVLGIVFTFAAPWAFGMLGISDQMPVGGYLPLIGSFLFVIGVAYWLISRGDLHRNQDLITVGTLYKLAYSAVAFSFWAMGQLPHLAFGAVFGVADLVFLVLMIECLMFLRSHPAPAAAAK